ncbi:ABC transporter ATP-binding protein [Pseudomonas sp. PB3P13]
MENLIDVTTVDKNYYLVKESSSIMQWFKHLVKPSYTSFKALNAVNFTVAQGAAVGFIGPNGAGKSSLIKILCGIQKPTSGLVRVLGHDPAIREKEFLRQIGVVFGHKTSLWWDLPVKTSFDTYKEIYRIRDDDYKNRLAELAEALNLEKVLFKPVRNLSLGERVKCELTLNLLHSPKLIFLDEPTVGLDVTSKYEIRKYLNYKRRHSNLSIFLTSHDLGDIESCCDDAIIVDKGRVRFDGSMRELSTSFNMNTKLTVTTREAESGAASLMLFKTIMGEYPGIKILNDGQDQLTYFVPRASLGAVFDRFKDTSYDFDVSAMDFESNVINLFKTWSSE